ncbi:hypothetical protein HID58_041905 [Brassica napus]|uniref:CST complex subunit CTC1 n=1 Tax=Brassica napus TaxID=3708 RepID=A0ABQ8BC68_BRANA|nr:hypothetical protein HID58_041905 [Brassica napus]
MWTHVRKSYVERVTHVQFGNTHRFIYFANCLCELCYYHGSHVWMKRHLDSPIGVDPNLLFWLSPRTFHLLYSFYCERRLISISIPETLGGVSASIKRHIDSRCFPSSPSPSIIAAPLTVGSKYMAASISIIPIHTVLSLAALVRNSANASGNCLTSFPCNLKVDGKSQYLCKSTVNVNSLVLLTYLKAGCHNYVEVRILSFWEARNVKHKGELMGLTCSSLTQSKSHRFYCAVSASEVFSLILARSSHVSSFVPQGGSLRIIQIKLLRPSNNLLLRHVCTLISRYYHLLSCNSAVSHGILFCHMNNIVPNPQGLAPDNSEPLLDGATVSYCVRET